MSTAITPLDAAELERRGPWPGISIEEAARIIRLSWERHLAWKMRQEDPTTEQATRPCPSGYGFILKGTTFNAGMLHEAIRDCGWCLGHIGLDAMHKAHDLALKGMKSGRERDRLSSCINHAFANIAGWYP